MRTWLQRLGAVVAVLLLLLSGGPAGADFPPAGAFVTSIPPLVSNPPPLNPAGETVVPTDPAFRRACLELIPSLRRNILLGHELTTQTKRWGEVLRIDFTMAATGMEPIGGRTNRLVFWRGIGGTPFILIAVGEPLLPLPAPPPPSATAKSSKPGTAPH